MKSSAQEPIAPIVQTTTVRRVLSSAEEPSEMKMPEFWSYIESLKPEDWERHIVYIYRMDPRASNYGDGQSCIDKCSRFIEIRPGHEVPFNDREEIELAIREKHGGKAFRLIVKRGGQRITEGKCANDAPPKYSYAQESRGSNGPMVRPESEVSATADIAKQALNQMAGQEKQSLDVAVNAVRAAGEMVTKLSQQSSATHSESETDGMMKRLMLVMLERALNPPAPPDPIDTLTKLLALQKTLSPEPSVTATNNPALDKIMSTALDRLLNPVSTSPQTSASAALVSQLPQVAAHVVEAIREWRIGSEAQRDTVTQMQRSPTPGAPGAMPANNPRILPPGPTATAMPANNPNPNNGGSQNMSVSLEFIESKIVEILKEGTTADEAADETIGFLDRMDPILVKRLSDLGEAGLVGLFQTRPILQQMTPNMPRVVEFIKSFMKFAKEMETPAGTGSEPPKPTLPN